MYIKVIYFFIQKSTNVTVTRVKMALHVWMEWTGIHVSVNQVSSEPFVKQVIVLIRTDSFYDLQYFCFATNWTVFDEHFPRVVHYNISTNWTLLYHN